MDKKEKKEKKEKVNKIKLLADSMQKCRDEIQVNSTGCTIFGEEFNYADLPLVLNAVNKILQETGNFFVKQKGVFHHETKMTVIVTDIVDLTDGSIMETSTLPVQTYWPDDPDPLKQYGSAITYVRRYSIYLLLGFLPEQDIDCQAEPLQQKKQDKQLKLV